MEEKKFIEFQKIRDFGTIIGDTFDFLIKNIKPFTKSVLIIMIPNFLVIFLWLRVFGINFLKFNPEKLTSLTASLIWVFVINGILGLVYITLAVCVNYDYIKLYIERKGGDISLADLWKEIKRDFLRIFFNWVGLIFFIIVLTGIVVGIIVLSGVFLSKVLAGLLTFFAIVILLPYVFIALWPVLFVIIYEKRIFLTAILRSFRLVFGKWWLTFGLFFVIMLVWMLLGTIISIPYYVVVFAFAFNGLDYIRGYFYPLFSIAFLILSFCGTFMYMIPQTAIALHYFNLKERKEATSLFKKVEHLENSK